MTSLRILVVEDDYLQANQLVDEIKASGDHVVGPFSDVHEAIHYVETAQAAILDVKVQDDTSFAVADSLFYKSIPFLFLTGYDKRNIPSRFSYKDIYSKPSAAALLLHNLHYQHCDKNPSEIISLEGVVKEMIRISRKMMPDKDSADRLVEGALKRAIAQAHENLFEGDVRERLKILLNEEFNLRSVKYLQ